MAARGVKAAERTGQCLEDDITGKGCTRRSRGISEGYQIVDAHGGFRF